MNNRRPQHSKDQQATTALITLPVAADFIRFEKNLLQMGFFGAHDTRYHNQATRRIEQLVSRDGQKIKVSAEFRGSQELGLPSTADRDKYIAFMRIAMEEKNRHGQLTNPIRFSGYRLLKQLGLCYSGENYEDINHWGQRMADTTITSAQVIYLAATKRYANKTVHVFRSFTRSGHSNLDNTSKTESYEVVLEDWLLENLNQSYVVPEDFNAYQKLKRPTAKGIFGYLHLWFHASHGRQVEKDYAELCILLNIPAYRHVSKIRETMGKSLNELADVGYLSKWDIRPMSTKEGYKLVLLPGDELLHVLAISQKKQPVDPRLVEVPVNPCQQAAINALVEHGVSPAKAESLAKQYDPESIIDQIEYAEFLISRGRRKKFDNPAGFIIYTVENQVPVPTNFVTSRRLAEQQENARKQQEAEAQVLELRAQYDEWCDRKVEEEISSRFPLQLELRKRLKEIISVRVRTDECFSKMSNAQQEALALQFLRRDMQQEMALPLFEHWCQQKHQMNLF
jgi:Replication initiator protein A